MAEKKPRRAAKASAERPMTEDGRALHLHTRAGDLAERCILVGPPERAEMIATTLMQGAKKVGDHRGLLSFTGEFAGMPVSVVTTGMGAPSAGLVIKEAVASGARIFLHVGSCGALVREARPGDLMISTGAARYDGASQEWAPIEWPAVADWRLVSALVKSAERLGEAHHVGVGVTTACFHEGQGRGSEDDWLPPHLRDRHEWLLRIGARYYSMEDSAIFVWCAAHGGYPAGSVNAVYANRITGEFEQKGDEKAARIALMALSLFH